MVVRGREGEKDESELTRFSVGEYSVFANPMAVSMLALSIILTGIVLLQIHQMEVNF